MEQKKLIHIDTEAARARTILLDTVRELLATDSMLKKLIGLSTTEELYFFSAVIAFGRFAKRLEGPETGAKRRSFSEFLESCKPVRNEVLLLLSEKSLGLKRPKKPHFFPCKRRRYM